MSEENMSNSQNTDDSAKKPTAKQSSGKNETTARKVWKYIWKFRGAIISIPVLVFAISQAFRNASILPDTVGLNIQATGEYAMTVSRSVAVVVPLLVTIGCTLMATFTKRPLFPWLISIFTLVLPVLIWVINSYPV